MGYGEFTRPRAAGRARARTAGGAPATQPPLGSPLEGETRPQVTRPGRVSNLTPIPARGVAGTNGPAAEAGPKAQGQARTQTKLSMASPELRGQESSPTRIRFGLSGLPSDHRRTTLPSGQSASSLACWPRNHGNHGRVPGGQRLHRGGSGNPQPARRRVRRGLPATGHHGPFRRLAVGHGGGMDLCELAQRQPRRRWLLRRRARTRHPFRLKHDGLVQ